MDKNLRSIVLLITAGTIAWLIAGAVFLVLGSDIKYVWTCVCGAALGVFGVRYTIRRSRRSGI
jgi:glycopeptide antibiotics resistance protein